MQKIKNKIPLDKHNYYAYLDRTMAGTGPHSTNVQKADRALISAMATDYTKKYKEFDNSPKAKKAYSDIVAKISNKYSVKSGQNSYGTFFEPQVGKGTHPKLTPPVRKK